MIFRIGQASGELINTYISSDSLYAVDIGTSQGTPIEAAIAIYAHLA